MTPTYKAKVLIIEPLQMSVVPEDDEKREFMPDNFKVVRSVTEVIDFIIDGEEDRERPCLLSTSRGTFWKTGSFRLRMCHTKSPGEGLPIVSLKSLHTRSAWHFFFVGSCRRMLLIRVSGRSSRLLHVCSCVHTFL